MFPPRQLTLEKEKAETLPLPPPPPQRRNCPMESSHRPHNLRDSLAGRLELSQRWGTPPAVLLNDAKLYSLLKPKSHISTPKMGLGGSPDPCRCSSSHCNCNE
ncbi:hypothetical protein LEMLEM_LOCUS16509 [Lemmus lemmus]